MTKIISGFPAIGKSYLANERSNVLDLDSSSFSWISEGVANLAFPENYIRCIKEMSIKGGADDYIFVSSHYIVRKALEEEGLFYTLIYPSIELKKEYMQRYKERGNDPYFLTLMDDHWHDFITGIEEETFPSLIKLEKGQYLKDVIDKVK